MATVADVIITFKTRGANEQQRNLKKSAAEMKRLTRASKEFAGQIKMLGLVALGTFGAIFANTAYVSAGFELLKVQIERVFLAITGRGFLQVMVDLSNSIGTLADKLFMLSDAHPIIGVLVGKVMAAAVALMALAAAAKIVNFIWTGLNYLFGIHNKTLKLMRAGYKKLRAEMIRTGIINNRLVRFMTRKWVAAAGAIATLIVLLFTKTGRKALVEFVKLVVETTIKIVKKIYEKFDELRSYFWSWVFEKVAAIFGGLKDKLVEIAGKIKTKFIEAWEDIKGAVTGAIEDHIKPAWQGLVTFFNEKVKAPIISYWNDIKTKLSEKLPELKIPGLSAAISGFRTLIRLYNKITGRESKSESESGATTHLPGFTHTYGTVGGSYRGRGTTTEGRLLGGGFQRGGIVPATGLALVHAGEKVIPADEVGRLDINQPITITVNVNGVGSPLETAREVAAEIARELGMFARARRR